MASRSELRRSLWGVDQADAEQLLNEREEPLPRERGALERAVALAESEAARLAKECEHLEQQIHYAEQRLTLIRQSIDRQRTIAPAQALGLHRHMAVLEREHARKIGEIRQTEAQLRAEIDERRHSLHRWAMALLQSVANRSKR